MKAEWGGEGRRGKEGWRGGAGVRDKGGRHSGGRQIATLLYDA